MQSISSSKSEALALSATSKRLTLPIPTFSISLDKFALHERHFRGERNLEVDLTVACFADSGFPTFPMARHALRLRPALLCCTLHSENAGRYGPAQDEPLSLAPDGGSGEMRLLFF